MKRLTAMILCLIMVFSLCACGVKPGGTTNEPVFTEPPVVTLADGSVVYSKDPFVEFPQTGEYKETALLTNVPGQGVPLLLDMRQDGTIDYIFADVEEKADFQTFSDSGAAYYTIAPDGTEFMKPGFTVPVVNTTGAGDAFNAGFIAAALQGLGLEDAVVWGNAVAAYKVGGNGSRYTPSKVQLKKFMAELGYEI